MNSSVIGEAPATERTVAEIPPSGPFSLQAAAGFGFGANEGRPPDFDGAMRLAFALDGGAGYAGAVLRQPDQLTQLAEDFPELNPTKVARLRAVAHATLAGELDLARLHELGHEQAFEDVQRLPGIGPSYAGLVVLRATGFADATLSVAEPKVLAHAARFYGLDAPPSLEQFAELAERWRPFRTWTTVLIRLAGDREAGTPPRRAAPGAD